MLKDTTKLKEWIPFINSIGTDVGTLNDALLAEKETISQISNDVSSLQAENTTIKSDIQSLNTQKASKSEIPVFDGITIKLNGTKYEVPVYAGATANRNGTKGLVPPATKAQLDYFLCGDGSWKVGAGEEVLNKLEEMSSSLANLKAMYSKIEKYRYACIGTPCMVMTTTLSDEFVWANGGLIMFDEYPEFAQKYHAGGFDGLVLPYNASSEDIAAYPGKYVPNAATPTGVYVPRLEGLFARYCVWILHHKKIEPHKKCQNKNLAFFILCE